MTHDLTLQSRASVTHDTHHLRFKRPKDLSCTPGQAVDLSLMREGWRDEARPFTPVNGSEGNTLDFIIKSYPDHESVTAQIATLQPGEKVQISDPWGAIHDAGPGTFIAGGAGITPFIAILRARLLREGTLGGSTLIFSNKTEADIILRKEFEAMEGLETIWLVTDEANPGPGVQNEKIDRHFLRNHATAANAPFYICGPDAMVDDIEEMLISFGIAKSDIIREDFS
ncbi:FAD-binding oxidoreductase [Thioclava sp. 15-R06ZXC-3]|uniref:FAD-binding oxidoreductase n=1 Tax=Thioclava arctica TaxID=3238301 RepID=A0ABV3TM53_9RHOB